MASSNLYLRAGQTPATNLKLRSDAEKIPSSGTPITQALESEVALSVIISKTKTVQPCNELTNSLSITVSKFNPITTANEFSESIPIVKQKAKSIQQGSESELSVGLLSNKLKAFAQASSVETALPIIKSISKNILIPVSTESSLQLGIKKSKQLNQAISSETIVSTVTIGKTKSVLLSNEADQSLLIVQSSVFLPANETDLSLVLSIKKTKSLATVNESNIVYSPSVVKKKQVNQLSETNTAVPIIKQKQRDISTALSTDQSIPLAKAKTLSVLESTSTELALKLLLSEIRITIVPVNEIQEALKVFSYRIFDKENIQSEFKELLSTIYSSDNMQGVFHIDSLAGILEETIKAEVQYEDNL